MTMRLLILVSTLYSIHYVTALDGGLMDSTKKKIKNDLLQVPKSVKSKEKVCKRDKKGIQQVLNIITQISSEESLNQPSSPQAMALEWLLHDDTFLPCQDLSPIKSKKLKRGLNMSRKTAKGVKDAQVSLALKANSGKQNDPMKSLKKSVSTITIIPRNGTPSSKKKNKSLYKSSAKSAVKAGLSPNNGLVIGTSEESNNIGPTWSKKKQISKITPMAPELSDATVINLDEYKDMIIQRYVLAVFYFSTNGDSWLACGRKSAFPCNLIVGMKKKCTAMNQSGSDETLVASTWLSGTHECEWGGLDCDKPATVDRIDFASNAISGNLPNELAHLSSLKVLNIEGAMSVNEYWHSANVYLSGTIPSTLGQLSQLVALNLNFNKLEGTLPSELFHLTNLIQLDLNENNLCGTISNQIGSLLQLRYLQLESNSLKGTIPVELGLLKHLEIVTLFNTSLTGEVPRELCSLRDSKSVGSLHVLESSCLNADGDLLNDALRCSCCTRCF